MAVLLLLPSLKLRLTKAHVDPILMTFLDLALGLSPSYGP